MELLANGGVTAKIAENGQEALDMLEKESFDGVLMDCQMPIMDGYTATREIRKQDKYKELPIIAMTANVMSGDKEKVMNAGMNDHFGKPINVREMFNTMAKWITPSEPHGELPVREIDQDDSNLLIPYLILGLVVKSFIKKKRKIGLGIGWGGLVGIVFMIIWGSWFAQLPYYTDEHVSSTTAIAFIFIPIYAIVTGLIGGVIGGLMSLVLTNKSPSS